MIYKRRQVVGGIQFIVESHFKSKAATAKELLSKIMIDKAEKVFKQTDNSEPAEPQI